MRTISINIRYSNKEKFTHPYLGNCEIVATHICNEYYPDYTIYSHTKDKHYRLTEKQIYQTQVKSTT